MVPVDAGDPAAFPAGQFTFQPTIAESGGKLVVVNFSPYFIVVNLNSVNFKIPPFWGRLLEVPETSATLCTITRGARVGNQAAIGSDVYLEQYQPSETVDEVYPQSVLGSMVSALTATQVINDGNVAVTEVLEATPSSGPNANISSALINNDGSGYLSGGKLAFDNAGNISFGAGDHDINGPSNNNQIALLGNGDLHVKSFAGFAFLESASGDIVLNLGGAGKLLHIQNAGTDTAQFNGAGALTQLGGQASAGSFGAPVIVAQALHQHITALTLQTLLTYAVPANGLYRISGMIFGNNGGTYKPGFFASVQGIDDAGATNFSLTNATAVQLNGVNIIVNGTSQPIMAATWSAKGGTNIVITYQDNAGTPNDFVTVVIERLA